MNEEVHKARTHRNKFAHFCWTRSTDEEIFGTNFSAGLPERNKELEQLYKESFDLVDKINQILEKLPEMEEEDLARNVKTEKKL